MTKSVVMQILNLEDQGFKQTEQPIDHVLSDQQYQETDNHINNDNGQLQHEQQDSHSFWGQNEGLAETQNSYIDDQQQPKQEPNDTQKLPFKRTGRSNESTKVKGSTKRIKKEPGQKVKNCKKYEQQDSYCCLCQNKEPNVKKQWANYLFTEFKYFYKKNKDEQTPSRKKIFFEYGRINRKTFQSCRYSLKIFRYFYEQNNEFKLIMNKYKESGFINNSERCKNFFNSINQTITNGFKYWY